MKDVFFNYRKYKFLVGIIYLGCISLNMKKLSSDILFYQGLAGLIIGPFIIFFFIRTFFITAFPPVIIPIFYVLLAYITIRGCYGVYKARRISFDDRCIFLENYFSKKFIQIPLNDVISITPCFTLYRNSFSGRKRYNITYMYDGRQNTIKFFKSLELFHVNNIENLIGLQQHKSVITNQQTIHDSNSIIAESLKINSTTRFTSAVMDWIIMTLVVMFFSLPFMIYNFTNKDFKNDGILWYIALIGMALFFCKDCIYGQSIAKRILKQQVVNNKTGKIANPIRCFVRDIFMILWPIEGVATLINPQRRLGDIIAGTKVIEFNPELKKPNLNYLQIAISFLLAYLIMLLVPMLF